MEPKRVLIASDHAGFQLKEDLKSWLRSSGWQVLDMGPDSDARTDYPDFADKLCVAMAVDESLRGILICGSGQGMAIRANRYPHIRAALCFSDEMTRLSREHNDANVLCVGSRFTSLDDAKRFWEIFSTTPFEGGRHQARVNKLSGPLSDNS